jgi:hypothetical protein
MSQLNGVSCATAIFCMADGYVETLDGNVTTHIERWDGTAWRVVPSPNAGRFPNGGLSGISCTSSRFCTAVGLYKVPGYPPLFQTLIERWNGSTWSVVISPNVTDGWYEWLIGVSCTSPGLCVAAGLDGSDPTLSAVHILLERS